MQQPGPSSPVTLPTRAGAASSAPAVDSPLSSAQLLVQVGLARATELARTGHYEQAERLLAELGRDREAQFGEVDLLARIRAQQGRFREAEALWSRALRLAADSPNAQAGLRRIAALQARPLVALLGGPLAGLILALALLGLVSLPLASALARSTESTERLERTLAGQDQLLDQRLVERLNPLTGLVQSLRPPAQSEPAPVEKVQAAFAADADLKTFGLTASGAGSAVLLAGSVPSAELKARAETAARAAAGTAPIDSSRLAVTVPVLGQVVEQTLSAEPSLKDSTIVVEQVGTAVKLRGSVPSVEVQALAETVAGRVSGVDLVDSRGLSVRPPDLAAIVRQALAADGRLAGLSIEAEQVGTAIRLRGQAPSPGVRLLAESAARGIPGVTLVDGGEIRVDEVLAEHLVLPGESLAGLALRYYGEATRWPLIYAANRDRLVSPRAMEAGMRLVIPKTS